MDGSANGRDIPTTDKVWPLGILGHQAPCQGRKLETITDLFLGMCQLFWKDHTGPGAWKPGSRLEDPSSPQPHSGLGPWLERAESLGSWGPILPGISFSPNPDKPHSVSSCAGLQDNQSELPRGLNERQLEKKCHFITSTELPSLEPICCQAVQLQNLLQRADKT